MNAQSQAAYPLHYTDIHKVALLTNPAASKGKAIANAAKAREEFAALGVEVEEVSGSSERESLALAREIAAREDIDAFVVCGGDGLINLALQAHVGQDTPLGIIPSGTGNDTARALGIPRDAKAAAQIIAAGLVSHADVGLLRQGTEQRYFASIACAGFDSLVNDRANSLRWPKGKARYNVAMVVEFAQFHSMPAKLTLADGTVFEDQVTLCAIGNTSTYGGGMRVCPHASAHDGLFDITIIRRINRRKAALNVTRFFSGNFEGFPEVQTFRTSKVELDMPGINIYADGDFMFSSPLTAEIVPQGARFIVPRF